MNQDTKVLAQQIFLKSIDTSKIVASVLQGDMKGLKVHLEHVAWIAKGAIHMACAFELAWETEKLDNKKLENSFNDRDDSRERDENVY